MKKLCSTLLVLSLLLPLTAPARAAALTRPSWCPEEEYVVFESSAAYEGENAERLLALQEHAAAGNPAPQSGTDTVLYNYRKALERISRDPGVKFELGLLDLKYALNAAQAGEPVNGSNNFEFAAAYTEDREAQYICYLWNARMKLASKDITQGLEGDLSLYAGAVAYLLGYDQFTFDAIYDCELVKAAVSAEELAYAKSLIFVTLDSKLVHPRSVRISIDYLDTTTAQSKNWCTMVPVRRLAELMGATVSYDAETRQITIERGWDVFVMTLDSTTAYRNYNPFQMDVAPYAENNRTYIPIRYIAEFFGQKVEWNGAQQHVVITEDKSVAGNSNLEAWALAMGALLNYENNPNEAYLFGGKARFGTNPVGSAVSNRLETTGPDFGRQILAEDWGITEREALMSSAAILAEGENAWDWFRVSHLAQWGYLAGYVTYSEALELLEPAAKKVCAAYSSWKEAYGAYLAGYCRWAGISATDVWQTERGQLYQTMLTDPAMAPLLNDSLFTTGIIGLPDYSES